VCATDFMRVAGDGAFMSLFGLEGDPIGQLDRVHYPGRERLIVRLGEHGGRELAEAHWGLVPFWAKDIKAGRHTFNARVESIIDKKPMFRPAFASKRCLLIGTTYLEWRTEDGKKVPYEFSIDGGGPYAYAGLWESWGPVEEPYLSCSMITTEPSELASQFHNRMPAILEPGDYGAWLDPRAAPAELLPLLVPFDAERMSVARSSYTRSGPNLKDDWPVERP
jgi:putative SOS response-associated peptidase YedK